MKSVMRLFLLPLLMVAAPVLASNGYQPVESIRAAALATVPAGTEAEAVLDNGLRMARCSAPLQARSTANTTVEVSCPDTGSWRLFVPIKIRREMDVVVVKRGVAAGETLSAADLETVRRDTARIAGAVLSDPQAVVGRVMRRTLQAGSLVSANDLVAPRLVRRGDNVALVSRRGGVEVRVAGRAMGDAGANERVSVENLSSRKILQGTVTADGDVLVSR